MAKTANINVTMDIYDLVDSLILDLTNDDLLGIIYAIDDGIADYSFTKTLRDKFTEIVSSDDRALNGIKNGN